MSEEPTTFWGHIGELAKRMKTVIVVFVVSTLVMFIIPANSDFLGVTNNYQPFVSVFLSQIKSLLLPPNVKLMALDISDPITLYVMAAVVFGVVITMPVFAYQVYRFVDPALETKERRLIIPFVTAVFLLFVGGAAFGFFFLLPTFINSLLPFFSAVGAELMFSIMDFYNMLFFTVLVSGFLFTIPAFFVLLVKFGVIRTSAFSKKRKYIYLGMVAAAMFISPGATPQGDLYLFASLVVLFEASVLVAKQFERNTLPTMISLPIFSAPTCRFCKAPIKENLTFCSSCRRAIK